MHTHIALPHPTSPHLRMHECMHTYVARRYNYSLVSTARWEHNDIDVIRQAFTDQGSQGLDVEPLHPLVRL
eukprot:11382604-Heterocapsa_arctica.AAC.1